MVFFFFLSFLVSLFLLLLTVSNVLHEKFMHLLMLLTRCFFSSFPCRFLLSKIIKRCIWTCSTLCLYPSPLNGTHAIVMPSSVNLNIFVINFNNLVAVSSLDSWSFFKTKLPFCLVFKNHLSLKRNSLHNWWKKIIA